MPAYDFKCPSCERVFELEMPMAEVQEVIEHVHDSHPHRRALCQSKSLERVFQTPSMIGSWFPRVDHKLWPSDSKDF